MRLNIEIIYEKIRNNDSKLYLKNSLDQAELFSLSGVRLYLPGITSFQTDYIYICSQSDYSSLEDSLPEGCSFLLTGISPSEFTFSGCCSFILQNSHKEPVHLLEEIQTIFDIYTEWMDSINSALLENQSLSQIFNLSARFLKNPIAMFDSAQTLIMTAGDFHNESPDSVWQEAINHGYALKGDDSLYLEKMLAHNPMPFYYTSSDAHAKVRRLVTGLHQNHILIGTLGMTELCAPIDRLECLHMYMVQTIMERALRLNHQEPSLISNAPVYLSQLLQGGNPPADLIRYQLSLLGQSITSAFILWVIVPSDSSKDNHSIYEHYSDIKRIFPDDLVFFYESRLLICNFSPSHSHSEKFMSGLRVRLGYLNLLAVYSMDYYNFNHLSYAYQQCSVALLRQDLVSGQIYAAKEALIDYMTDGLKHLSMSSALLHPGTILLISQNHDYGQQLLKTLQAYCICGGNISAAAKMLFIHRHTMLYRMECISKIAYIDFNSLKPFDYVQISISCLLLLQKNI